MPKKMGPSPNIKVSFHTLVIDESAIYNTTSMQRATLVSGKNTSSFLLSKRPFFSPSQSQELDSKEISTEYALYRIGGHQGKERSLKYKIWRYGYFPEQDTIKPPANTPHHFIYRYWIGKPSHSKQRRKWLWIIIYTLQYSWSCDLYTCNLCWRYYGTIERGAWDISSD